MNGNVQWMLAHALLTFFLILGWPADHVSDGNIVTVQSIRTY
jgi:hypothetical protein